MAPFPSTVSTQMQVPSHLVGRLIGKGGATIKELERLTGCRVQTSTAESKEEESMTRISVHSLFHAKPSEREREEARCARAAQLLMDGLSLPEALAQSDAELEAQTQLDKEADAEREECEVIHRIRMEWPEFDVQDVRSAVREVGVMFPDDAIEMLLNGYRAPCARPEPEEKKCSKPSQPGKACKKEKVVEHEEFPALPNTAPARTACSKTIHLGCAGGNRWSRVSGGPSGRTIAVSNVEDFPALPEQKQEQVRPRQVAQRCRGRTLRPSRRSQN